MINKLIKEYIKIHHNLWVFIIFNFSGDHILFNFLLLIFQRKFLICIRRYWWLTAANTPEITSIGIYANAFTYQKLSSVLFLVQNNIIFEFLNIFYVCCRQNLEYPRWTEVFLYFYWYLKSEDSETHPESMLTDDRWLTQQLTGLSHRKSFNLIWT